ncbi:MAG: hypothetical protein GYA22_02435 [Bacteroidales bacterium]|nr:hypothetical protein [Bacteroidales bacterium]
MVFKETELYGEFAEYPLKMDHSVKDIEAYSFPDPHTEGRFQEANELINEFAQTHGIIGDLETSIFEAVHSIS